MIIGVDLDGCAYPFVKNFVDYLDSEGFEIPDNYYPKHWNFFEDFGLTNEEFFNMIEKGVAEEKIFTNTGFMDMPEPGFSNVIVKLRAAGHHIHIVTHRNAKGASEQTLRWLKMYGIPYDALHFVKDKTVVKVDLLIEDSPHNWAASCQADIPCILFRHAYNEHCNATFVEDWHDVYELIPRIESEELSWVGNRFIKSIDRARMFT